MSSARASKVASDESNLSPVSSAGDLMEHSQKQSKASVEDTTAIDDTTSDLLTGAELKVTKQEVPHCDEIFMDSSCLDYLLKCAESNRNLNPIDSGKESLFIKFDPLYAQKLNTSLSQTESVADSTEADGGYETGSAASVLSGMASSKHSVSTRSEHSIGKKDKPIQVVPEIVINRESEATTSNSLKNTLRATPPLVRSVSAILTPMRVTTDKLINLTGSTPPMAAPRSPWYHPYPTQEGDRVQELRNIVRSQDQEMLQLRHETRELKSMFEDKEHNYLRLIESLKAEIQKFSEEKKNLMEEKEKFQQQIHDKDIRNRKMSDLMEEYETTMNFVINKQQRDTIETTKKIDELTIEKDQALNHLTSMEGSFMDLLSKYERCKNAILVVKKNEKIYQEKITEYEAGLQKYESIYNTLKQEATRSLAHANVSLETLKKNHNVDVAKLNATIKKHEMTMASLQESVVKQTKEKEELAKICDQLINEVR